MVYGSIFDNSIHLSYELSNIDPNDKCVFFDDLPENLISAKSFGWITVLINKKKYVHNNIDFWFPNIYLALKSREMGKTPGFLRDVEETKKDSEILINEIPQVVEEARRVGNQAIRGILEQNFEEPMEFEDYLQRIAQRRDEIQRADDLLIEGQRMRREMPKQVATDLNLLREAELINYPDPEELINDLDRLNI